MEFVKKYGPFFLQFIYYEYYTNKTGLVLSLHQEKKSVVFRQKS